jgi:hypothetical protein
MAWQKPARARVASILGLGDTSLAGRLARNFTRIRIGGVLARVRVRAESVLVLARPR